jgi:hypothetical protein
MVVLHQQTSINKGDSCAECDAGKLYKYEPATLLRIIGQSPFKSEQHVMERLRCNACGAYFTAPLPEDVLSDGSVNQKYGYSARSIMGISKFGMEVLFNPKITEWQSSYDGRRKEPINLPVKFPLLLAQGAEGIAVGLSTKVLPHNFIELIEASIKHLQGKRFKIFPDFPTGGAADISNYNDGLRGGKVRVRAKMHSPDKSSINITEIPFSTTTSTLIDSVLKANEKGKIKIGRQSK